MSDPQSPDAPQPEVLGYESPEPDRYVPRAWEYVRDALVIAALAGLIAWAMLK